MGYHSSMETLRERETLKYYNIYDMHPGSHDNPASAGHPQVCRDQALTSFAQLGAFRLNARRALISLFDSQYQYVVAEATRSTSLSTGATPHEGDELWLSCGAIKRTYGICGSVLTSVMEAPLAADPGDAELGSSPTASLDSVMNCNGASGLGPGPARPLTKPVPLPVVVVPDLSSDERFQTRDFVMGPPHNRFYAGVPIQTPRCINIGVLCVFDDHPRRSGLTDVETEFLVDMSQTIMTHLEADRFRAESRRSERMVRGLGSFVEGNATLSGWWSNQNTSSFQGTSGDEGCLDARQQDLAITAQPGQSRAETLQSEQHSGGHDPGRSPGSRPREWSNPITVTSIDSLRSRFSAADIYGKEVRRVFDKAANVLRESIEVEGIVFFDGNITSFGGMVGMVGSQKAESDSDDSTNAPALAPLLASQSERTPTLAEPGATTDRMCRVLAYSTSDGSSINPGGDPNSTFALPESFLKALLRRYPKGKVFNFDEYGFSFSSESDERDPELATTAHTEGMPGSSSAGKPTSASAERRKRSREYSRKKEVSLLSRVLPGARAVVLVPLWDSHRQRWFAGALGWTRRPSRTFTVRGELSYLSAFGSTLMAQIARLDALLADQAKSDVLGAISHELRSPLHGALGGIEMLMDTDLDNVQRDIVGIIETCSRTLLETIDHLLEFSKINNFKKVQTQTSRVAHAPLRRRLSQGGASNHTVEAGMMSLSGVVDLSTLAEEVLESVYAGHNFLGQQGAATTPSIRDGVFSVHSGSRPASRRMSHFSDYGQHQLQADLGGQGQPGPDWASPGEQGGQRSRSGSAHSSSSAPLAWAANVAVAFGFRTIDDGPAGPGGWCFNTQPGAITRILMNLFGNALKYTASGIVRVTVAKKITSQNVEEGDDHSSGNEVRRAEVMLTVADTGKGISDEYLRHQLYTPFSQEDRLAPGTGLGLSLVHHMVHGLGGHIGIRSRQGIGTEVTVTLPLTCANEPTHNAASPTSRNAFETLRAKLNGLTVALVGFVEADERLPQRRYSEIPDIPEATSEEGIGECAGEDNQGWRLPQQDIEGTCRKWLRLQVVSPGRLADRRRNDGHGDSGTEGDTTQPIDVAVPNIFIITETELDHLPVGWASGLRPLPAVVVICRTTLSAKSRSILCKGSERRFEWTSQPCGPRKLARAITAGLKRISPQGLQKAALAEEVSHSEQTPPASPDQLGIFQLNRPIHEGAMAASIPTIPLPSRPPLRSWSASAVVDARANRTTHQSAAASMNAFTAASPASGGKAAERNSFLLVEDNVINLKILVTYMKRMGYLHDTAADGLQALETYKRHHGKYRYILMDISMPVMDGLTASRHIRNFERTAHIPATTIIALTGLASANAQEEAFASGIDLFLTKPVSLKELGAILTRDEVSTTAQGQGAAAATSTTASNILD